MNRNKIIETMARGLCSAGAPNAVFTYKERPSTVDRLWPLHIPRATAALSALEAAGLVVVPVEPTEAMLDAVFAADLDIYWSYAQDGLPGDPKDVYTAMIKAAQEDKP